MGRARSQQPRRGSRHGKFPGSPRSAGRCGAHPTCGHSRLIRKDNEPGNLMPILELPDARIAYDLAGSGPPIVFLHGVGSNRQTWRAQIEAFSATHTVVAIDARGYGDSWTRPGTVSMARLAADTAGGIQTGGGGRAHRCGLFMGGHGATH